MRVLILGGYGLIGSHVTARLLRAGIEVTGLARDMAATRRFPGVRWVEGDLARMTEAADWAPLLDGVNAVVNCAGALQDGPRDSLQAIHVSAPKALYRACDERRIRRIVLVSAAGILGTETNFARSKRAGEMALAAADLDWIVMRPGLVMAPTAYGGTALLRALAAFPFATPVMAADRVVQVVSVDDVASSVVYVLGKDAPQRAVWEPMHPAKTTLGDVVRGYRSWLGFSPRPLLRVPMPLARLASFGADVAGLFGWRSPLRTTSLRQLAEGVTGEPDPWMRDTGIVPRSLADIFAEWPSGVQERWFARLYLLKALGILVVSAFWIFSGAVALGPGFDRANAFLEAGGMSEPLAWWTTVLGGLLDLVLGTAVLFRRATRAVLIAMIAACVGYLAAGSVLHPELWFDALGVFAKILPIMLAMGLLAAIADER